MQRSDINELHYITPIANVPSILRLGILSHRRAERFVHHSVAMAEIQERRARRMLPTGMQLHDYANLYFSARNPMMYRRRSMHRELCVLRVSPKVLDLPGVVIADGNASSDYTAFWPVADGLKRLDKDAVFADDWTAPDYYERLRRTRIRCAEVLVPHVVGHEHILGVWVSCQSSARSPNLTECDLSVIIFEHLFFL